jgi:glutamate synthase domain-containing protein 3
MYIYGDAQEDLGDAMNGGLIAVYGNVGDAVGQAKRGGEIYVYGNAGNRAGIQHRGGVLVIGLSSSHMCLPQTPWRCISYPAAYTT